MSTEHPDPAEPAPDLADEVERIVESGERIRERVRDALARAAARAGETGEDVLELGRRAVEGGVRAVRRATPEEPDSPLRQVVDGVGDGVARTAQATRLAVQEAWSEGRAYARADLERLGGELRGVGSKFAETIGGAAARAFEQGSERARALREHAARTASSIEPSLRSALDALTGDPLGTAEEAARGAAQLAREGAGALFRSLGDLLHGAGERLSGEARDE